MPYPPVTQFEESDLRDRLRNQRSLELAATRGRSTWRLPTPLRSRRPRFVPLFSRV